MSTALKRSVGQIQSTPMQSGSLLEHLYTFFSLTELQEQLDRSADESTLRKWGVSQSEYHEQVRVAIEYVERE